VDDEDGKNDGDVKSDDGDVKPDDDDEPETEDEDEKTPPAPVKGNAPGGPAAPALGDVTDDTDVLGIGVTNDVAPAAETEVLGATVECVARWGLSKTTLDDVARAAGVSRATVYRLFPGGRDVLVRAEDPVRPAVIVRTAQDHVPTGHRSRPL